MAAAFPNVSWTPSVSLAVMTPRSKSSIAQAMVEPVEIVSRPYSLQR